MRVLLVATTVPVALVGLAGTASADPGNGHGNSASAPGQLKKQVVTAPVSASPTTAATATSGSSDHSRGNASTTGNYDQSQPYSNADQNNTGANDTSASNPYKSTRDGSPSGNGNGNGKATGKPCAGCVGKADNKNPKGQAPNGSDHNAGYECDRNHGIGRTNPAHTGCKTTTPPPTDCTTTRTCPPQDCKTTGTCPLPCEQTNTCPCPTDSSACSPAPCNPSTEDCSQQPPATCDDTQFNCTTPPVVPPTVPTEVKALHHERVPTVSGGITSVDQLPFTGSNVSQLLLAAGLTLLAGAGLMFAGRRPGRMHN